jgi:glutamate-ammonia-ligase adenylyltransferase
MGSFGGRELSLSSDADVLWVHQPVADSDQAQAYAVAVAGRVRSLLGDLGPEPGLDVDSDLRPEGRLAPLARSLGAYEEYYDRWALPWERQALLRARPLAGDDDVLQSFMAMADPVRYKASGLPEQELMELRRLKARVDSERLPRGVEPSRHLKLGPGGLLDVQWIAQLLALRHAGQHPSLQVTGTLEALAAAERAGLLGPDDSLVLSESWTQAMRIRDANLLWSGRVSAATDVLAHDRRTLGGVARILGYEPGEAAVLEEDRHRVARRARGVFEHLFYG